MNELQVKTIEIKPAVIEFNHEDIEKELESSLKKYEGLVFTEDSATDLRKTLAELRKGKNAVDRYRIDTKKQLNEPVTEFEKKCKQLDKYFEDVITPLTEQQKEFEEKRRAEKLAQLQEIRLEHIKAHGLDKEYHDQVVIDDSMLPKSASLKMSGDSLEFQVKNLKMEQDKKAADKELIITTVKLANSENDLSLSADAYVRLVEFTPFEQVKNQIEQDASSAVEARERAERVEKERIEREKQAEQERIDREKKAELEKQFEKEMVMPDIEPQKEAEKNLIAPIENEVSGSGIVRGFEAYFDGEQSSVTIEDLPFGDIEIDMGYEPIPEYKNKTFLINANKKQFDELMDFMQEKGIDWRVIDESV